MELAAIRLLIDLCREYACPVHIVHLATAAAIPMLRAAKAEGLPLTVETAPHYLFFAAEEIPDGATQYKCAPPIRDAANREGLWEGLREGVIDTIGSDHSPCPPAMKNLETGEFAAAWGGIASLQWLLPIVWTGARERGFTVEDVTRWLSANPARLLGLHKRGTIAVGAEANFVVWDPEAAFRVRAGVTHHRHKVSPYNDCELYGEVRTTFLRENKIYRNGEFAEVGTGRVVLGRGPVSEN
jgi:allantoinase